MKKTLTNYITRNKPKSEQGWQTGVYSKTQQLRFHIPYGFLLLCKLWNTTPDDVLTDFMDCLAGSIRQENKNPEAIVHIQQFALSMTYGQHHYTKEDIQTMFAELNAIALLWPQNAETKFMEMHARWRQQYYNWWFEKWYGKYKRK